MAKTKQQKQTVLKNLEQKIKTSSSLILTVFDKLPVKEDRQLRTDLKKAGINYEVIKKTLLKKSLDSQQADQFKIDELRGNLSLTSALDEIGGAKILTAFAKGKEDFKILGGWLNHDWMDAAKIFALAKLPSKLELIQQTVWAIKAPLSGLAKVLAGNLRGLVNVLNALKDKK